MCHLVDLFRELRRALKDDGTIFLNLGDSFSNGVMANLGNVLQRLIEGGIIFLAGSSTLAISAKSDDVLQAHDITPDLKFSCLLGVKRILFKKRDDDFCQVLNLLDAERDVWVSTAVPFVFIDDATLEIVVDEMDSLRVVVTDDDLEPASAFGVFPVTAQAGEYSKVGFPITESGEPTAKVVTNVKANGHAITLDSLSKCSLKVDTIDKPIALTNTFDTRTSGLRDFSVTKSLLQHLSLSLMGGAVELAIASVGHLFISNQFGSLVRYGELYDKAKRMSNAQQPKQELGIPEMVKRALMEDGWICRSTIIWHKPNPMPESVTDRPTKSHEYIFLLSKSAKYYYDADAVREPFADERMGNPQGKGGGKRYAINSGRNDAGALRTGVWERGAKLGGRNRRSVWTVTTKPFRLAHFATFPEALIEPCILAGTSAKGECPKCGAAWVRVVERTRLKRTELPKDDPRHRPNTYNGAYADINGKGDAGYTETKTLGWEPQCACGLDPVPQIVLDPFSGAGTTGVVAKKNGRRYIGIELNPEYLEMARERIEKTQEQIALPV